MIALATLVIAFALESEVYMQMDLESMINLQKEEALKVIAGYEIELEKVKELLAERTRLIDSLRKERDHIRRVLERPKRRLGELRG